MSEIEWSITKLSVSNKACRKIEIEKDGCYLGFESAVQKSFSSLSVGKS